MLREKASIELMAWARALQQYIRSYVVRVDKQLVAEVQKVPRT